MPVDNQTPFPAIAFRQYNLVGALNGVVAVRGTFEIVPDGALTIAGDQHPLVMSDIYEGDPHETPQLACTDLAPYKPGTDVTFIGASHVPGGEPRPSWTCALRVGSVEKRLRVTGPRSWRTRTRRTWKGLIDRSAEFALDGWDLTEPEPVAHIPIDWRLAYGGHSAGSAAADEASRPNPIGRGIVDQARFRDVPEWPAPQIELESSPIAHPDDTPEPAGLGPIAPFWRPRQQYAGTYDDAWLAERHPLLPTDFDFRFWQAAPPGLVADPWLIGTEPFRLENLAAGRPLLTGRLPGLTPVMEIDQGYGPMRGPMVLDGVHFDMRPEVERVYLTWRVGFPWPERRGLPRVELSTVGREIA